MKSILVGICLLLVVALFYVSGRGGDRMVSGVDYWVVDSPETLIVKIYLEGEKYYLVSYGDSRTLVRAHE